MNSLLSGLVIYDQDGGERALTPIGFHWVVIIVVMMGFFSMPCLITIKYTFIVLLRSFDTPIALWLLPL